MHTRLLSFLSDFENAVLADDPSPSDGTWKVSRTVNYHLGLARLVMHVLLPSGKVEPRGSVLLQSYKLADDTPCLKTVLSWQGSTHQPVVAIYAKPDVNWKSEARKVAAEWMADPPAGTVENVTATASSEPTGAVLAAG